MQVKALMPALLAFGVPASMNLLSIMVFTRLLNLHTYGELSLAWVSIEFTCAILYKWSKMGMMRFFDKSQRSVIIGIQFIFLITVALLLGMVALRALEGTAEWVRNNGIIYPIIFGIIAKGLSYFIQDVQRICHEKLTRYTIISFLCNFAYYLPAIFAALWTGGNISVEDILYIQAGTLIILCLVISFKPLWQLRKHLFRRQNRDMRKSILKYGVPISIASIAIGMFVRIDRYVIEYTLGFRELGIFSAAFSLSNLVISSIFSVLTISTYPEIIRKLNAGRTADARTLFRQNGTFILTVIPISVLVACLLNNMLCHIFFGAKAADISGIFPYVLLATYLFNLRIHYFDQVFQFTRTTQASMYLSFVLGAGHLALSYKLSHVIGLAGVALSNALMSLAGIIFTYFFSLSRFRIELGKPVLLLNAVGLIAIIIYLAF